MPRVSLVSLVLVALTACGEASQTTRGGDARFDASRAPGEPSDAGAGEGGSRWADLYRDYFGPSGMASCAGDGQCHGGADQPGAKASGYICAGGKDGCYSGISTLVVPGDPEKSFLHQVLRKSDGTGIMPKRPVTAVFSASDMGRVDDWIRSGAPNP